MQQASEEIIGLLGRFNNEWGKFTESLEKLGRSIGSTQKAFEDVNGPRRRMLERPLRSIEALRQRRGILIADVDASEETELPPGEEEAVPAQALLPTEEAEEEQP